MKAFIVTAYRYGMRDAHSYVVGAYPSIDEAKRVAEAHIEYRGGKYAIEVVEFLPDQDEDYLPKQVFYIESPYHGMLGSGRQPADTSSPNHKQKFLAAFKKEQP